jgi:hypothetical protein
MRGPKSLLCLSVLTLLLSIAGGSATGVGSCAIVSSFKKIRPQDLPAALRRDQKETKPYRFTAARGETVSVQVVCLGPLAQLGVQVVLQKEYSPIEVSLYSQEFSLANQTSDCEGKLGLWPDPLVPFRDPWYGEQRNVITSVPQFQTRSFWVDFNIPRQISPGFKNGSVLMKAQGLQGGDEEGPSFNVLELPFALRVRNIILPATSPFAAHFAYWPIPVCGTAEAGATGLCSSDNITVQSHKAADLGLQNRVSTGNIFEYSAQLGPSSVANGPTNVDWEGFERDWGRYILPSSLGSKDDGPKMNSFTLPSPFCGTFDSTSPSYCGDANVLASILRWQEIMRWAREKGVDHLLWIYGIDEPSNDAEWRELKAISAAARQADPSLRVLATTAYSSAVAAGAEGDVGLWCPIIQELDPKSTCQAPLIGPQAKSYRDLPTKRDNQGRPLSKLWSYSSCVSHGCDHDDQPSTCYQVDPKSQDADYTSCVSGWPSKMIDHSLVRNRVHGWTTWLNGFEGEVSFDHFSAVSSLNNLAS